MRCAKWCKRTGLPKLASMGQVCVANGRTSGEVLMQDREVDFHKEKIRAQKLANKNLTFIRAHQREREETREGGARAMDAAA